MVVVLSMQCHLVVTRHEIISNDTLFYNTEKMVDFLKQYFKDDSTKEYHMVDPNKMLIWGKMIEMSTTLDIAKNVTLLQ